MSARKFKTRNDELKVLPLCPQYCLIISYVLASTVDSNNLQAHKLAQLRCERNHKKMVNEKKIEAAKKASVSSRPHPARLAFPQAMIYVQFQRPKKSYGSNDNPVKVGICSCTHMS